MLPKYLTKSVTLLKPLTSYGGCHISFKMCHKGNLKMFQVKSLNVRGKLNILKDDKSVPCHD